MTSEMTFASQLVILLGSPLLRYSLQDPVTLSVLCPAVFSQPTLISVLPSG